MKVIVIGTGGVGGYFGGKLAQNGHQVYFLARNKHLKAIIKDGLKVKSIDGDFQLLNVHASNNIKDFPKANLVLVCTKADQVKEIAPQINHVLMDDTMVLPLQNGLASEDILEKYIDKKHIVPGLCKIYSKIAQPGIIHHFGWSHPVIQCGEFHSEITPRLQDLQKAFVDAGIKAFVEKDIWLEKWKKFMFICSGGLLALTRSTYGEIREHPQGRKMLKELFTEVYQVGKAKGILWNLDVIEKAMQIVDLSEYEATASMQRDINAKKPSELEYLNGAIVRWGRELKLETPINKAIVDYLSMTEYHARK